MNKGRLSFVPEGYVLVRTSNDGAESQIISGLLKANDIDVYVESEGVTPIMGEMDTPIPKYNIYVPEQFIKDAQNLLASTEEIDDDYEWKEHKRKQRKRGMLIGRIIGILTAIVFFVLSFLPNEDSDKSMKYVLVGASLFFVLVVLFSFYEGKSKD